MKGSLFLVVIVTRSSNPVGFEFLVAGGSRLSTQNDDYDPRNKTRNYEVKEDSLSDESSLL